MAILGNTLGEIAGEKAGIIKEGVPVVCSAQAPEAVAAIERVAAERHAPLVRVGPAGSGCDYTWYARRGGADTAILRCRRRRRGAMRGLELALLGEHQIENATVALALAERSTRARAAAGSRRPFARDCARCAGRGGSRSSGMRRWRLWIAPTTPTRSPISSPRSAATSPGIACCW